MSTADGRVRVRLVVAGSVQGVWYRDSCRRVADRLGVAGWVRNTADGRVEIEAEGSRRAVEALVEWARRGPDRAGQRLAAVNIITAVTFMEFYLFLAVQQLFR